MFGYDTEALRHLLATIIQNNIKLDAWTWLSKQGDINNTANFNAAFAMMPRKTGKAVITITTEQAEQLNTIRPGFVIEGWTADRLGRVYLLLQADATNREHYFAVIENLFLAAEMNELVALYSALPILAYPDFLVKRCAEGIRSNIGSVLEAIMYHNPYPAEYLPEAAWNQLVMKAIFTDKRLDLITGLNDRNNPELARILMDFARERGAAGRSVVPELWHLASPFTDAGIVNAVKQQYSTI
ncbi:EboA domain-containing protein [Mucilaginibacter sp. UR6-1]|uniref:EboA domain-containing protein n=1 Tax=Mucilaginibacter sp. UR6-1 TaxID=1435643 RepID=UPI001E41AB25|nr:EboA domain-containing protein [Mucilaginibacter sp. UR6-1]MCC8409394.1 EboA domain-containing protein [Mucilaginibacter sp. UR6-1]